MTAAKPGQPDRREAAGGSPETARPSGPLPAEDARALDGPGSSVRLDLARVASAAAVRVPGVASVGPRPTLLHSTQVGSDRVEGVVCAAEPGGRYGIVLYLGAEAKPFRELGEKVRERVVAAAGRAGLEEDLGSVDVVIDELVEPGGAG